MNQPQEQIEDILTAIRKACPELNVETSKDWEDTFYDSGWDVNTLKIEKHEEAFMEEMSYFMPRHMQVYDWNLPYNEAILLRVRRHFTTEPHLEHLLRAISKVSKTLSVNLSVDLVSRDAIISHTIDIDEQTAASMSACYDLSQSLRQNLENTDLREFIHSLLNV